MICCHYRSPSFLLRSAVPVGAFFMSSVEVDANYPGLLSELSRCGHRRISLPHFTRKYPKLLLEHPDAAYAIHHLMVTICETLRTLRFHRPSLSTSTVTSHSPHTYDSGRFVRITNSQPPAAGRTRKRQRRVAVPRKALFRSKRTPGEFPGCDRSFMLKRFR